MRGLNTVSRHAVASMIFNHLFHRVRMWKASVRVAVDETDLCHCIVAFGCGLESPINETQIQRIRYGARMKVDVRIKSSEDGRQGNIGADF